MPEAAAVLARVVALASCLGACAGAERPGSSAAPAASVVVAAYGPVAPTEVPGRSLYLVRYEITPGTRLRPHRHEGTQIGLVASGTLTYHVLTGQVPVYRAGEDGKPAVLARTLTAGEVGRISAGEWVVERPDVRHWGANQGPAPLVVYTSSLLRAGAPLATLDPP